MLINTFALWISEKKQRGTSLHRRLLLFFMLISVVLVLVFALLLTMFGINGKDEKNVSKHLRTELSMISQTITDDFSRLSLGGISIAEEISAKCDEFFLEKNIKADELTNNPTLIEPLLSKQMPTLINTINNYHCGGVFILLDSSVKAGTSHSQNSRAGIFIKKTQPTATHEINVKLHYLRGPAKIARDNDITLLGQWKMEYNISGQDFFNNTMDTARANPDLPLSRLFYWSERVTLKGNSEAGFLLCVPLRSKDGTVFGLCGMEVSDRMFKTLFTPTGGSLENIFTVAGPSCSEYLGTKNGIIAGNYYLSSSHITENLYRSDNNDYFETFKTSTETFGGKSTYIQLYSNNSPYREKCKWSVAILMPEKFLNNAVKGRLLYFIYIVIALLIVSLLASFFISRKYIEPVTNALHSIKNTSHEERQKAPYHEINDLFEFLAAKDREREEEMRLKDEHNQQMIDEITKAKDEVTKAKDEAAKAMGEYEKAQLEISRLAYSRKTEIDPDLYQSFLTHLSTLTRTERNVFDLYISGKSAKEILEIMNIKENTLKYHNKNIYSKLGVSSRKELLRYATLMRQDNA